MIRDMVYQKVLLAGLQMSQGITKLKQLNAAIEFLDKNIPGMGLSLPLYSFQ